MGSTPIDARAPTMNAQRTEAVPETPHASDGLTLDDFMIQGLVGEGEFGKVQGQRVIPRMAPLRPAS